MTDRFFEGRKSFLLLQSPIGSVRHSTKLNEYEEKQRCQLIQQVPNPVSNLDINQHSPGTYTIHSTLVNVNTPQKILISSESP